MERHARGSHALRSTYDDLQIRTSTCTHSCAFISAVAASELQCVQNVVSKVLEWCSKKAVGRWQANVIARGSRPGACDMVPDTSSSATKT